MVKEALKSKRIYQTRKKCLELDLDFWKWTDQKLKSLHEKLNFLRLDFSFRDRDFLRGLILILKVNRKNKKLSAY